MKLPARFTTAAIAVCLAALPWGAAQAGSIQIVVTDKDGKPAADVVVLVASAQKAAAVPAAAPVLVLQQDLRFVPFLTVVPQGSTVRFVNRDGYDHHVRSTPSGPLGNTPPVTSFEMRLDGDPSAATGNDDYKSPAGLRKRATGTSADIKLDKAGPIGLGCHIHSSMRGQLYVSATPWFGKTDANGALSIDGVPDGDAELSLWHSDQLQDQPGVRVQVSATPAKASAQLNFTPRRRRV